MIEIKNLNKYYNSGSQKFHALKDINLTFPEKGFYFITGKSGSGKSTLLNIIGGIDSYDSGDLIINNLNTNNFKRSDFNAYRNSYIGFIFQEFNVIKNLSVFDNIALSLRLKNINVHKNENEILEVIEKVGLKGKEHRKMNQLSGGERQRVAIARAIIKNPEVIIADEPTGNLDKKNRDIIMGILKEISVNKLVIMVTHDTTLADKYGDFEITLKDGQIISERKINEDVTEETNNNTLVDTNFIKPIQPKLTTSMFLSFKNIKLHLFRFLMIALFFTISLIFAESSINLYFSNATDQYTAFQSKYHNDFIKISHKETLYNQTISTGFFDIDARTNKKLIEAYGEDTYTILNSIPLGVDIRETDYENNPIDLTGEKDKLFYLSEFTNIITLKDLKTIDKVSTKEPLTFNLRNLKDDDGNDIETNLTCYITDIMADSLIAHNYFYEDFYGNYEDYFAGKYFKFPGMNEEIYIKGIIFTDYNKFAKKESVSDEEYEYFYLYDANYQASYYDNKAFYGALFMIISDFVSDYDENQFVSTSNLKYTYDDFIFKAFDETDLINNVKVSMFTDSMKPYIIAGDREGPKKPKEGELEPIMVSKKFYDLYIKADLKDTFPPKSSATNPDPNNPDNLEYGDNELINPTTGATAVFSFYGYKRITTSFNVKIVGVIDNDDEATIYFCNKNEDQMYYNYLKTSYSDYANDSMGGYLILKVSDDLNKNATLYSDLTSHDLVIDNISYVKLQVVNDFIDSNLILFLGIFFALCLFSILMIFNYVVITIKNSRKDIGIYMSLGMNGFKISFIYLFQVLLVSASAFILASIGANIFLKVLDHNLSATAANLIMKSYNISIKPIDFTIFKLTKMGYLISLAIAFVAPLITIAIPLISLSRKKPIDVIKIS